MKPNQIQIYKKQNTANLKFIIILLLFVCLAAFGVKGQTKRKKTINKPIRTTACKIGTTNFRCPKDFVKEQIVGEDTILFKQNNNSSIMYFFVAISRQEFDDTQVRNVIAGKISGKVSDIFRWKDVKEPLAMNLETKYEKKIVNRLGYNYKLINFQSRYFEFNGKTIVLGYGYDTDSDGLVKLFEKGDAIGDNAIGCNAIATTLNSITKENKGNLQYCTLSAFSASE